MCDCFGCGCKGSSKFVCFDCRTTAKGAYRPWGPMLPKHTQKTSRPNCPKCRKAMVNLGVGARIPAKTNDRRWKSMEQFFAGAIRKHHQGVI